MQTVAQYSALPERPRTRGPRGCRDRELVHYIGRSGAVAIEHVMVQLDIGQAMAYRRVGRCIEAGLLERLDLLRDEPSVLRATRDGLKYVGLGMKVAAISPGSVTHWLRCATVAQRYVKEAQRDEVLTEREIPMAERLAEQPIARAKFPYGFSKRRGGKERWHCPDLAVLHGDNTLAVEVELSPKGPRRLTEIMDAWGASPWVAEVAYLCAPGQTFRGIQRAVKKADLQKRICVVELNL